MRRVIAALLTVLTANAIADEPQRQFGVMKSQNEKYAGAGWTAGFQESRYHLGYRSGDNDGITAWRYQHAYRIFRLPSFDGSAAGSNGHVHALSLRWQRRFGRWRTELEPVLAVSSNRLAHPGVWTADDMQLHGMAQRTPGDTARGWWWGIGADDRLGDYRVYPAVQWRAGSGRLRYGAGWPDSEVQWRPARDIRVCLALGPDGGRWRVGDTEEVGNRSTLSQRRWRTGLSLHWHATENLTLTISGSRLFRQQWRYRLRDGRDIVLDVPDASVGAAEFAVQF